MRIVTEQSQTYSFTRRALMLGGGQAAVGLLLLSISVLPDRTDAVKDLGVCESGLFADGFRRAGVQGATLSDRKSVV